MSYAIRSAPHCDEVRTVNYCPRSSARFGLHLLGVVLLASAGCDITGVYESRFKATLDNSGKKAAFDAVLFASETEITGEGNAASGVKLRLPSMFDKDSKSLPATEPRVKSPLPGVSYALERSMPDDANAFAPCYIYFAAVPKSGQTADELQASIATLMKGNFPSAAWSDAQFKTPQGGTITHKVIRGDGQQDFDLSGTGGAVQKLDGRFALYFIESPTHYAMIGFRAPKAQSDRWKIDAAIEAAMGTVTVAQGAAAPAAPAGGAVPAAGATPAAGAAPAAGMP